VKPHDGQLECDTGVIIMGYAGDPVYDNPSSPQRPSWTKNGSLLIVRKLEQDVVLFQKYLDKRGKDWKRYAVGDVLKEPTDSIDGAELLGAQMIGRWKSVGLTIIVFRSKVKRLL
jgi:deferrochelatase/peroxidase EfeB